MAMSLRHLLFLFLIYQVSPLPTSSRTYIAEWEFQKRPWRGLNATRPLLRHRIDAAYWSETSGKAPGGGDWWLFGGKGFEKQYSDLWKFYGNTLKWERIYPKTDPIVRAMVSPEKISQPILCGHHTSARTILAVYGPKLNTDTVWVYEVNDTLWTSYVCCCEKQNSKHTFCPNFSKSKQSPVAWCDTTNGALLSVVPNSTTSTLQLWRFSLLSTRWEHVSLTSTPKTTTTTKINCNFDNDESSILYTSTDGLLYILCTDLNDKLKRYVYRYPNLNGEIEPLGYINLNIIPQKISITATRTSNGKIYLIIGYQQLIDLWLLNEKTSTWISIDNIYKGNTLKWFQAVSSNSGIYYLNLDGNYIILSNPKLNEQKSINKNDQGVIQEQGIFIILISKDDGTIIRGEYGMKKNHSNVRENVITTTVLPTVGEITTEMVGKQLTTTEWSAELVMEGVAENISTCCWNFSEVGKDTIVAAGNDRALLELSPQVNEITRPLKSSADSTTDSYGALIFFVASISLFAIGGIVLFAIKCIRCPNERNTSTILKEPPPIRYSVIPDELTYPSYPNA